MTQRTTLRERCANCRFLLDGLCRRLPPTMLPEVWRDSGTSIAKATWPEVDDDDWCGEWRLADE